MAPGLKDLTSSFCLLGSENSNKNNNSPRTSRIGGAYGNKRGKNTSSYLKREEINMARK